MSSASGMALSNADVPDEYSTSCFILTSLLFTTLILSYIPQAKYQFCGRIGALFAILALVLYLTSTFLLVQLMQLGCEEKRFGGYSSDGFLGFMRGLIGRLQVGLQWMGLTHLFPAALFSLCCALRCYKMPLELSLLSQDYPDGLGEKTKEPAPPGTKTIILVTSTHSLVFLVWSYVSAAWPRANDLDIIIFAGWTCILALVSAFMVFMPKFPKHYSPHTLKIVDNWMIPVLCLQASAYFILAGSLAARFGVRHALSTKKICSPSQSIWIAFLVAGCIQSVYIFTLYLIPQPERDVIYKAEVERLAAKKAEAEKEAIQKSENTSIAATIDDQTPLLKAERIETV